MRKHIIFCFIFLLTISNILAQPGGGGPGGVGDPDVPLGGLELLLLAGAALGVRSITNNKRNK